MDEYSVLKTRIRDKILQMEDIPHKPPTLGDSVADYSKYITGKVMEAIDEFIVESEQGEQSEPAEIKVGSKVRVTIDPYETPAELMCEVYHHPSYEYQTKTGEHFSLTSSMLDDLKESGGYGEANLVGGHGRDPSNCISVLLDGGTDWNFHKDEVELVTSVTLD